MRYYDEPGHVYQGDHKTVLKWRRADAARDAAAFGGQAKMALRIAIERSTNPADPCYGQAVQLFADDAYKAAVRAARIARMRIDLDPLTVPQHRMLAVIAAKTGPDGWADWTDVYNAWDPGNVPVQFAGKAAAACWKVLASRNLVETDYNRPDLVRVVKGA